MPKKSPRYRASQAYCRGVLANERRIQYLEAEIEKQQSRLALNGVEGGESVSRTMEGDSLERGYERLYEMCDIVTLPDIDHRKAKGKPWLSGA